MSSRGARAVGTDGSDHLYRENVPAKKRLQIKQNLKTTLLLHVALWVLLAGKLFDDLLNRVNILIPDIAELAIPKPVVFEYVWIASLLPTLLGLASLSKNNTLLLKGFIVGILILGVIPIVGGMVYFAKDFVEYFSEHAHHIRHNKNLFLGKPIVVLWYIFFACALQVHLCSLFFAKQLHGLWDKGPKLR